MEPLLRGLLAIVPGDADWLEALRVLIAAESRRESWKTITAISPFSLDFFTYLTPEEITVRASRPSLMCWRKSSIGG
jgi:hypothetical protein